MAVSVTAEDYYLYPELCFIPSEFDQQNIVVGRTTRSACAKLCSQAYSKRCSAFLYDRQRSNCTLTPFTGEAVSGTEAVAALRRGCNQSTIEFYRRVRRLGTSKICSLRLASATTMIFNLRCFDAVGWWQEWHLACKIFCASSPQKFFFGRPLRDST